MKKMLDELKKMDYDYKVPADFSKKVMHEIRNIEAQKKRELKKYVITWASTAAVIVIAVAVSLKTSVKNNMTFEKNNISQQVYDSSNELNYSISSNETMVSNSFGDDQKNLLDAEKKEFSKEGLEESTISNDNEKSTCAVQWFDSSNAKQDGEIRSARSGDTCMQDIENLLLDSGVNVDEVTNQYIIVDSNIEDIKTILSEYKDLVSITEINGKVKIQKEV